MHRRIQHLISCQRVNSTNDTVQLYPAPTALQAQEQITARGRYGRSWSSAEGGLYLSYRLPVTERTDLYKVAAVALHRALAYFTEEHFVLKQPNDLLNMQLKKVAGILIEKKLESTIIGVGVNLQRMPEALPLAGHIDIPCQPLWLLEVLHYELEIALHEKAEQIDSYYHRYLLDLPVNLQGFESLKDTDWHHVARQVLFASLSMQDKQPQEKFTELHSICMSVSLLDSPQMIEMQQQYRQESKETDVLAFPAGIEDDAELDLGDIFVCLPVAERQAQEKQHRLQAEITFLMVHATLHLLGYDHATAAEEREMFALQERIAQAIM